MQDAGKGEVLLQSNPLEEGACLYLTQIQSPAPVGPGSGGGGWISPTQHQVKLLCSRCTGLSGNERGAQVPPIKAVMEKISPSWAGSGARHLCIVLAGALAPRSWASAAYKELGWMRRRYQNKA